MKTVSPAAIAGSAALSAMAGYVDAIGFVATGGLFVSFMSGNSTQAGVEAVGWEWKPAALALLLVASFVAGVFSSRVAAMRYQWCRGGWQLICLSGVLAAASATVLIWKDSHWPIAGVATVMGATNTLLVRDGRARVPITYATGTLVSLGLALAEQHAGGERGHWGRPLILWSSMAAGAIVGAMVMSHIGVAALGYAVLWMLALGVVQIVRSRLV